MCGVQDDVSELRRLQIVSWAVAALGTPSPRSRRFDEAVARHFAVDMPSKVCELPLARRNRSHISIVGRIGRIRDEVLSAQSILR
ncbi:hypothetical protein SPRG_10970 [Saprolegnia parasitica CBS 223.65]|uniref:Uncharacterized protein n=1 Tax=Saprolegnia parasitica (strain CBS 223.65) TaxID=695850 RepID=A0A067C6I9_SAPPC|nr:hypothetical protein SPRG_10970 [Saprolegnia parasitica CBS 223.65]KDO22151.1 hypothetical protein SPRG_10970 [Saprolegnia parasitica CBS 223.65]|eukprot:XP_012207188.1 hypothetical protein SPRG_10970 [Saprolegnia parasitica CBS 223.65]